MTDTRNKGQPIVSISLKLPKEMVELLRDVSLARHFSGVANKATGMESDAAEATNISMEGISIVVSDLVERNRDRLESEAVKAGIKKRRKSKP